ncbi:hypothetical protein CspeluHIS016_0112910 [Cutaneotrichosporon spelunceum]|uniref:Shugoshin C-terminal domain-containing protein n=1 Tax=Cutaneotrichosporon spelunceum TaxID=1672016 RepID=A0AAD3TQ03_9TREE|nr:hypothetical protein CspeluHIS016_0112910 [Cutaneotrichosporon spelunceum]
MAARRSRRSSGLGTMEDDSLAEFETFRRRHARQNREIITENITRKGLIRSLQDQVATLQADLLSERRQKAALSREIASLRDNAASLDAIIGAVPQLMRSPRKSKSPTASTPTRSPRTPASASSVQMSSPLTPAPGSPASEPSTPSVPSLPSSSTVSTSTAAAPASPVPLPQSKAQANDPAPLTVALTTSTTSTSPAVSVTSASPALSTPAPEDGRSRRARTSVSYKEPSLRTKMRKPDGVSSEEALGLRPRGSMLEGVRRKSALPRSSAKMDFRAEDEERPTPLPSAVVVETAPKEASKEITKEGGKKAVGKRRATPATSASVAV